MHARTHGLDLVQSSQWPSASVLAQEKKPQFALVSRSELTPEHIQRLFIELDSSCWDAVMVVDGCEISELRSFPLLYRLINVVLSFPSLKLQSEPSAIAHHLCALGWGAQHTAISAPSSLESTEIHGSDGTTAQTFKHLGHNAGSHHWAAINDSGQRAAHHFIQADVLVLGGNQPLVMQQTSLCPTKASAKNPTIAAIVRLGNRCACAPETKSQFNIPTGVYKAG